MTKGEAKEAVLLAEGLQANAAHAESVAHDACVRAGKELSGARNVRISAAAVTDKARREVALLEREEVLL